MLQLLVSLLFTVSMPLLQLPMPTATSTLTATVTVISTKLLISLSLLIMRTTCYSTTITTPKLLLYIFSVRTHSQRMDVAELEEDFKHNASVNGTAESDDDYYFSYLESILYTVLFVLFGLLNFSANFFVIYATKRFKNCSCTPETHTSFTRVWSMQLTYVSCWFIGFWWRWDGGHISTAFSKTWHLCLFSAIICLICCWG